MPQERRHIDQLPADHRRVSNGYVFLGIDDNGVEFELRVQSQRRHLSSSGVVKAQIRSMSRGRPLMPSDLYEDVTVIALFVDGRSRLDIHINPNGTYSVGPRTGRTLKEIVGKLLQHHAPSRQSPTP